MQLNNMCRDIIIMIAQYSEPVYSALARTCSDFSYLIELKKDFKRYFGHILTVYEKEVLHCRRHMIHRLDGPAYEVFENSREEQLYEISKTDNIILQDGACGGFTGHRAVMIWLKNGKIHRDNGPAMYKIDGGFVWYQNGKIHRNDGPAIIHIDGRMEWVQYGLRHRDNGPAIETYDMLEWYQYGILHNLYGPARINQRCVEWWIYGQHTGTDNN